MRTDPEGRGACEQFSGLFLPRRLSEGDAYEKTVVILVIAAIILLGAGGAVVWYYLQLDPADVRLELFRAGGGRSSQGWTTISQPTPIPLTLIFVGPLGSLARLSPSQTLSLQTLLSCQRPAPKRSSVLHWNIPAVTSNRSRPKVRWRSSAPKSSISGRSSGRTTCPCLNTA